MKPHPKIKNLNGFRALATLNKIAADPRVAEIEGYDLDEGRVFVHLMRGYKIGGGYDTVSFSAGTAKELMNKMEYIEQIEVKHD